MSFVRNLSLIAAPILCATSLFADPIILDLWPGDAPGSEGLHGEEVWTERGKGIVDRAVAHVDKPTLTVYLPLKGNNSGAAVLVAPGGGYRRLAIDKEGHDVAKWLASIGVAGLVVKYRLPRTEGRSYSEDTSLVDAQRAIRIARARAEEWGIDPKRLGMMGFSAGGHLAMLAGTKFDDGDPAAEDPIERQSSRPDFLAPIYPAAPKQMNITKGTPPTFLVHANDDGLAAEKNSVRIYLGLKGLCGNKRERPPARGAAAGKLETQARQARNPLGKERQGGEKEATRRRPAGRPPSLRRLGGDCASGSD